MDAFQALKLAQLIPAIVTLPRLYGGEIQQLEGTQRIQEHWALNILATKNAFLVGLLFQEPSSNGCHDCCLHGRSLTWA